MLRWSRGRVRFSFIVPVLLLRTTGARTGVVREAPLLYAEFDDRTVVVGSNGAQPSAPGWCHNLRARNSATWMKKGREYRGRGIELQGADRDAAWEAAVAIYPGYAEYAARMTRRIPVFELISD